MRIEILTDENTESLCYDHKRMEDPWNWVDVTDTVSEIIRTAIAGICADCQLNNDVTDPELIVKRVGAEEYMVSGDGDAYFTIRVEWTNEDKMWVDMAPSALHGLPQTLDMF